GRLGAPAICHSPDHDADKRHNARDVPQFPRPAFPESSRKSRALNCGTDMRGAPARTSHLRPTLRRSTPQQSAAPAHPAATPESSADPDRLAESHAPTLHTPASHRESWQKDVPWEPRPASDRIAPP